jgi:hypothetical protein
MLMRLDGLTSELMGEEVTALAGWHEHGLERMATLGVWRTWGLCCLKRVLRRKISVSGW